jgi:hypothetical protein
MEDEDIHEAARLMMVQLTRYHPPDYEARALANQALQIIASHERLCLERAKTAVEQRERMEVMIRNLISWQQKETFSVLAALLSGLGFFLAQFFHR